MNILQLSDSIKSKSTSSNIQIYYNRQFPLNDILDVFYPLFHADYPYDYMVHTITAAHHVFCAYDHLQRRTIACALVNDVGRKGGLYLTLFGVRQSSQHHGVGTQLLKAIIRWARSTRHSFIYLHVRVDNYKAIGLYEKLGFRRHEYLRNYYRGQNAAVENPDGLRMVLLLQ